GRRTPAHASATGKALLAFQPAAVIEQVLRAPLQRYTARTITDAALLRAELEQVRRRGYAVAHEELQAGLTAVAAPIREADGRVQAVLSLSAPTYRTPPARQREHARLVVQAAAEVSRLLGYVDKPPGAPRRQAGEHGTEASMCGIAGLLYKSPTRYASLGQQMLTMLDVLGSRGVDGTGVALYGPPRPEAAIFRIWLGGRDAPADQAERALARVRGLARVLEASVSHDYLRLVVEQAGDLDPLVQAIRGD